MIPPLWLGITFAVAGVTMATMTSRSDALISPGMFVPTADERIVIHGYSWADYETQVAIRGEERRSPKLAFLDGVVELMSPSHGHERTKFGIGQVLVLYCLETGLPMFGYGQWRLGDETKLAGAEPDECYVFGREQDEATCPHLVIEVIWTSGGIDKLAIYQRLGIREVWFWSDDTLSAHVLGPNGYEHRERSVFVPDLDLALVCELAKLRTVNEIQHALRAALRR